MFCWPCFTVYRYNDWPCITLYQYSDLPCITVYQYSETNVMHFLFSLLRIKGLYIFRALLAHPRKALHKRHLVYWVCVMSVDCARIGVELVSESPVPLYLGLCKYTLWRSHNHKTAYRRISQNVSASLSDAYLYLFNTINAIVHYGLPDKLHGYMFRPLSCHLQAHEVHKNKIIILNIQLCSVKAFLPLV
jgi:hypothetical protein